MVMQCDLQWSLECFLEWSKLEQQSSLCISKQILGGNTLILYAKVSKQQHEIRTAA